MPAGADEQPRGAGQPQIAIRGEGEIQVAEAANDGAVPGAAAGSVLGAGAGDPESLAGRDSTERRRPDMPEGNDWKASCVRGQRWSGSARSVVFRPVARTGRSEGSR